MLSASTQRVVGLIGLSIGLVSGTCTNSRAKNYNIQNRTAAEGICFFEYCNVAGATNYQSTGITSKHVAAPWICTFSTPHCTDPAAANYRSSGTILLVDTPSLCQYAGCNDTYATNYDSRVRTPLAGPTLQSVL